MKQIILVFAIFLTSAVSLGQRKIKKVKIRENGYNTKIVFHPIIDEIEYNGLHIKIIPVSPDELNSQFLYENNIDGKFKYTYLSKSKMSYFLKKRKKIHEKTDFEFLYEGAQWLLENELINQNEYDKLIKQIIYYYDTKTGYEIFNNHRIVSSNPYFINNKYLSVFKIIFSNNTHSDITFNELITLQNGNNSYNPLSYDFILDNLQKSNQLNLDKLLTLERHNLNNSLVIPSNSSIEKLFAVIPIDFDERYLNISFTNSETKFKYDVSVNKTIINKFYTFYEFKIYWQVSNSPINFPNTFNLIKSKDSSVFLVKNNFFVDENYLTTNFEIFTLALWDGSLYYGRNKNIMAKDYINREKNKRSSIILDVTKIKELKKKVKQ